MSLVSLAYFDSPFFVSLSAEWFPSFFCFRHFSLDVLRHPRAPSSSGGLAPICGVYVRIDSGESSLGVDESLTLSGRDCGAYIWKDLRAPEIRQKPGGWATAVTSSIAAEKNNHVGQHSWSLLQNSLVEFV